MSATKAILDGIRIVDMANGISGPVAAMLLAEAGADVIKVEPPGGSFDRESPGFLTWNRSKRGVVLDIETPEGRERLADLLGAADVLIHDIGPTRARTLGLDDAALAEGYPNLIVSSVLSWPVNHPDADRPVDELLAMARLGICDEQQPVRRDGPLFVRFPLGNWCSVYLAASGIVARLISRGRTGKAGPAHTSLVQGALVPMAMHWTRAETPSPMLAMGSPKEARGSQTSLFECADGLWLHLMSVPDRAPLMQKALAEMGEERVAAANEAAGKVFGGYPNRGANIEAFLTRPSHEWLEDFWASDVAVQPALSYGAVYEDKQARENRYIIEHDHPEAGRITVPGNPLTINPPQEVRRPAPSLGEHTDEVLKEWTGLKPERTGPSGAKQSTRWPLEGVKVLDMGNFLAGPYGPMILADLGADVIKLESIRGDGMRGVAWAFAGCQRGKRSVSLDLKAPASRPALEALVRWADVVHHNQRMPAARRLEIDYESLVKINPELIYCHTSSYGPAGPRADWPGYDQLFQALCGWEALGAGEGNPPMWHRFGFMDHSCALSSVVSVLLGLYERDRSGEGQFVAGSLLGAGVLTASETYVTPDGELLPFATLDADQTGSAPGYRIIELTDGWVAVAAKRPEQLKSLCSVAGTDDPERVPESLRNRTSADVLAVLESAGVPAEAVRLQQRYPFLDDADNQAAGLATRYRQAEWGMFEQTGGMWYFENLDVRLDRAPPALGEHTIEILTEVGLERAAIDKLLAEGVAKAFEASG